MAIVQAWRSAFPRRLGSTRDFASVIRTIDSNTPTTGQIVIQVPAWGGVLVTEIDIERVNVGKFLAVRSGRYLALEWHEAKDEHMACREGAGLLLYRHGITGPLSVMVMTPGAEIDLKPGDVHCLIACEDLLIYETSKDRKGMDQDLKFIYLPQ